MGEDYPLLRDMKPGDCISRVDKWSIVRYWDNGAGETIREMLFYPSEFGMGQIREMAKDPLMSDKAQAFNHRLNRLILDGDARWEL
jgi:hypothetical protein